MLDVYVATNRNTFFLFYWKWSNRLLYL